MATGGEVFSEQIARGYDVNLKSGTGTYAKGGKIEYYKDGEPILDTMEKEKMLKPLDDYGYYLKIGNVIHYYDDNKNWETSKFGFAKKSSKHLSKDLLNFLAYSDGSNSLDNISQLTHIGKNRVRKIFSILKKNKLIF